MTGAVFSDMEGTLLRGNTPRLYIKTGLKIGIFSRWEVLQAAAINFVAKVLPSKYNTYLRFLALGRLHKGRSTAHLQQVIEATLPALLQNLKPALVERLRHHQAAGQPVVIVSGAIQQLVERLALELGARGEGTRVEIRDGICTGRQVGPVCQGEEKARRVREVAQELQVDLKESIGYGDTLPDAAFLSLVGTAAVIDPPPEMRAEAERRGWEVIYTEDINSATKSGEKVIS